MKLNFFFFILSFLLTYSMFHAQTTKSAEIDSLILLANQYHMEENNLKVIELSQKILNKSDAIQYKKGLSYGNYYLATTFYNLGKYKESLKYIDIAGREKHYLSGDFMHHSRIYGVFGDNYLGLGLYSQASKYYHNSLKVLNRVKDKTTIDRLTEATTLGYLSQLSNFTNQKDSVYFYLQKEQNILSKIPAEYSFIERGYSNVALGDYYFDSNDIDSSSYYYNKSLENSGERSHPFMIFSFSGLGNISLKERKYTEALKNYFRALAIDKNKNSIKDKLEIYKKISDIYHLQKDYQKSKYYLDTYIHKRDSLEYIIDQERSLVINEILKQEKEFELKKSSERLSEILGLVAIFFITVSLVVFFVLKRRKKVLGEKELLIHKKEIENQQLQSKVNEYFDNLVALAKNNSPEFWARFQETYPDFRNRLLSINPDLKSSELILSAYIYLGFNTKDIAEYTFKAVKTIKNNKYNLRKRLEIPTKEDFVIWMRNRME